MPVPGTITPEPEPVEEESEPVGNQDAARGGRRVRHDLETAVGHGDGPPPDDTVGREILGRQEPVAAGDRLDDRASELTPVEAGRTLRGKLLEGPGEIGQ